MSTSPSDPPWNCKTLSHWSGLTHLFNFSWVWCAILLKNFSVIWKWRVFRKSLQNMTQKSGRFVNNVHDCDLGPLAEEKLLDVRSDESQTLFTGERWAMWVRWMVHGYNDDIDGNLLLVVQKVVCSQCFQAVKTTLKRSDVDAILRTPPQVELEERFTTRSWSLKMPSWLS